jgi:hypothetical protein
MPDRWETFFAECRGGLIQNEHSLAQGLSKPGSAIELINYEPALKGGYRRVDGYAKYDSAEVTGTGDVLGVKVFNGGVVACRNDNVYFSTGSGWVAKNTSARTGAQRYNFDVYNMAGTQTLVMADGVNKPAKWNGTTWTDLSSAPTATSAVAMFKGHLFSSAGRILTFSVPNDDTDYTPANGAGSINVSDDILQLRVFRDNLIVFCRTRILRVVGSSLDDFAIVPIANNLGTIDGFSVQEVNGDLIFLASDGIRPLSATERIGDFEIGGISRQVHQLINEIGATQFCSVIVRAKTQYRLFPYLPSASASAIPSVIGGIRSQDTGWEWGELRGFKVTCSDSGYVNNAEIVVHGSTDGFVYRQETGTSFNGANIATVWQTPHFPINDPSLRKTLHKFHLYARLEGTCSISYQTILDSENQNVIQPPVASLGLTQTGIALYDDGVSTYDASAVYDGQITPVFDDNLIGSAKTVSFRFTTDDQNPAHTMQAFVIEFNTQGRR